MDLSIKLIDVVGAAGLTQREVSKLLRVSLVTANRYLKGGEINARFAPRVATTVNTVEALLAAKKLPLRYVGYGEEKTKRAAAVEKLLLFIDGKMRG